MQKQIKHKKPPRIEWVFVDPNGQYLSCLPICYARPFMIPFLDEWNLCDANDQQPKHYARKRGHLRLIRTFIETPDAKQGTKIGTTQFCSWSISPSSVGYACVIGIWWFYPIFTKYNEFCINYKHSFCITSIRSLGWPSSLHSLTDTFATDLSCHFTQSQVMLLMEEILHQLVDSLSHYLHGFRHTRWLFGSSSINTI